MKFKNILVVFVIFAAAFVFVLIFLFVAVLGDHVERRELISRNDATNTVGFPLVNSATNIFYYQDVGGLQSLDEYTRLTVAKSDITNQIGLMVVANNRELKRNLPYLRTNINSSEIIGGPTLHWWNKSISWWTPNKITNGYYVGEIDSYAYQIWVDESSGTLFIHCND